MQLSGGPFSYNRFDEYERKLEEAAKKAKKDYDGDGKIESGKEEYFGSRDKAIKKAMGKDVKEEVLDEGKGASTPAKMKKKVDKAGKKSKVRGAYLRDVDKDEEEKEEDNQVGDGGFSGDGGGAMGEEYVGESLTGERQMRARDMKGTPYMKGGGKRTSRDNVTLHNLATRNDGPGTPGYEKKSTGGKGGKKYAGYGDQGAGNKARRRMGQEPIRGTRKEGWEMDAYVSALDFMSNRWQ